MKHLITIALSCLLFAVAAPAQNAKPATMLLAVPKLDAATAQKAADTVRPISGVVAVEADLKASQLKLTLSRDNLSDTRKAVRQALKKAKIDAKPVDAKAPVGDSKKAATAAGDAKPKKSSK
jgi:uncharacterized membrane protein